jgi:tetratricopeptide (TPR) repeat protein
MASLIPGFEYDIFISYRQKDNKGDRWVSEFVEALKTELESTFKEEISVYFDINPHDGLLETHDVDASLKEKLKCLVFIPIISRTYCDPKSFAWEHEFKAFVEQASQDQFGLKVKLPNGNVASRVLPIRIHDLDIADMKLCESVLGGVLRGVDFIYKEPGVDKPLAPEDNEKKNLNSTIYRIQLIKVAHAIKEIILGMKEPIQEEKEKIQHREPLEEVKKEEIKEELKKTAKLSKRKLLTGGGLLAVLLVIAAILVYPKIFNKDKFKNLKDSDGRISIAVMPFENLTGDTTLNWFQRGISSLIINGLGNSSELSVLDEHTMSDVFESMNKVFTAGLSPSMAKEVAGKVKAETYISGSYQGRENSYWILVNLVNTETGDIIWTNKVQGDLKSSGYLNMADSLCNEIKNYLEIKALEKGSDYDFREVFPRSAEAYRYFIEGMNSILNQNYKPAIQSLEKALEIDSTFTFASFYIAWSYAYGYANFPDQYALTKKWIRKAYNSKDRIPPKYQLWLEQWYASSVSKNLSDILRYNKLLEESGVKSRLIWFDIGVTYIGYAQQYNKAIEAFEKVMEISQERGGYWKHKMFYWFYGTALHKVGKHKEENEIYEIAQSIFPDYVDFLYKKAVCSLSLGDTTRANDYIEKYKSGFKKLLIKDYNIEYNLGCLYSEANILDKAETHFRNAYEIVIRESDSIQKNIFYPSYNLALLLINNDIDVREGMEIVSKRLEIDPDSWALLGLKGWGFYKQGKNEEAIQFLRMAEEKSPDFDFDLYQHIQEVEKALASQKNN